MFLELLAQTQVMEVDVIWFGYFHVFRFYFLPQPINIREYSRFSFFQFLLDFLKTDITFSTILKI